jgi:hypothetical protein
MGARAATFGQQASGHSLEQGLLAVPGRREDPQRPTLPSTLPTIRTFSSMRVVHPLGILQPAVSTWQQNNDNVTTPLTVHLQADKMDDPLVMFRWLEVCFQLPGNTSTGCKWPIYQGIALVHVGVSQF